MSDVVAKSSVRERERERRADGQTDRQTENI